MQQIHRHKTAIRRLSLSRPVRIALDAGLLTSAKSFFDYGCGRGDDLRQLAELGITCWGWDPVHRAEGTRNKADIVNLGYVVNVIEDPEERRRVLLDAFDYTLAVLVVSARLDLEVKGLQLQPFRDGWLTKSGTFQKFYSQNELREWVDCSLGVTSVAAAPGVFLVFREEWMRQQYLATGFQRRSDLPSTHISDAFYAQHRNLLEKLAGFVASRGRLPEDDEMQELPQLREVFGSTKRAFTVLRRATGKYDWDEAARRRSDDLLVYLACAKLRGRPSFSDLPKYLQLDCRAFFGHYKAACEKADLVLRAAGNGGEREAACAASEVGKLTNEALYAHRESLPFLPPALRVYEGCARFYVGELEGVNLVKLHRRTAKISYLSYPSFDEDPHPSLIGSLVIDLGDPEVKYRSYSNSDNPPILHRKEQFVPPDYPHRKKFARLTAQEEKHGLYDDTSRIGFRKGWEELLESKRLRLIGHRLIKAKESFLSARHPLEDDCSSGIQ